jgi:hypothetical protein|tara:strand:+ start:1545 stop:2333 length:789 start_codon:yes stop_codon:yes gene_type:complete
MDAISTRFLRNKDLIPIPKLTEIGIVGLGGIGSFLLQNLTVMGWQSIWGWDSDRVEDHNFSSTAYPLYQSGKLKKEAADDLHREYSEDWQQFRAENNFQYNSVVLPKMIVCTDDMESRRMVYDMWKDGLSRTKGTGHFFIDLRMGATTVEMSTVTRHTDNYLKEWIPTSAVEEAPCSMKHTVFATQHIVSLGSAQVYNMIAKLAYYDYIWSSLSPNMVEYGTLIVPKPKGDANAITKDSREESFDRLEGNASRSNVATHRSA